MPQLRHDITPARIQRMRDEGMTLDEVAADLGCSKSTLLGRLSEHRSRRPPEEETSAEAGLVSAWITLRAIAALHSWQLGRGPKGGAVKLCSECGDAWPCQTRLLADPDGGLDDVDPWFGGVRRALASQEMAGRNDHRNEHGDRRENDDAPPA